MAEDKPEDTMFQDAVDALRRGDRPRAKEVLTLLLKTDQNNPTYWIWLSASVDNTKERIYCLQTALKLDPENGTAKRGLILLGALTPDESIQPFPMNRPRAWEEKLLLANETPKEKGFKAFVKSPIARLAFVLLIGAGLISAVIFGFVLPRRSTVKPTATNTPGPSPTFTATPTLFGAIAAEPTKGFVGPTPLWMFLTQTYTPTALYVNTPRAPQSKDQYRLAESAYKTENWDEYISNMRVIASLEPESADVYYLIGDAYRFKGDWEGASEAYNEALKIDENFGPAYLGLARAKLLDNPKAEVDKLFDQALELDPNFGEVYLERARYHINNNDPEAAIVDLGRADKLIPNSPAVYMVYADAYLALDDKKSALDAAETAYSLDITNLEVYKLLGKLYIESGDYKHAIESLDLYAIYETEDDQVFALLGQAYYEMGDYKTATDNFNKAEVLNKNGLRKFLVYKGLANLELNNLDKAVEDLEKAASIDDTSFEVNLGLLRAYYLQEKFGSAFLKAEALKSLAETDQETATMLYWHALVQEKRGEVKDAIKDWKALLAMKANVMTEQMRSDAELHLKTIVTPTNTPKGGVKTATPRATSTPRSGTVTPTPKGGTVTVTPTPK